MNYEACCGATALKKYFDMLSAWDPKKTAESSVDHQTSYQITSESSNECRATSSNVSQECVVDGDTDARNCASTSNIARMRIQQVESRLLDHLLGYLRQCAPLVRIVEDVGKMTVTPSDEGGRALQRIPIVCFTHVNVASRAIVRHCREHEVACRAGKFLSTARLWEELGIEDANDEVVRFSLAHYNTLDEINRCVRVLELLVGWS